jgi:hypothetical protein
MGIENSMDAGQTPEIKKESINRKLFNAFSIQLEELDIFLTRGTDEDKAAAIKKIKGTVQIGWYINQLRIGNTASGFITPEQRDRLEKVKELQGKANEEYMLIATTQREVAIEDLRAFAETAKGLRHQTLLGVTGSGKTYYGSQCHSSNSKTNACHCSQ